MRLEKIKLAGFKSFVDPTTVVFPGNLNGVVGPNGCGKSNTIDAVRWVMGESSAKTLRGESMADVIFNGSNSRKPVGQASVELVFENSDGRAGGQYAGYNQISVKRQVSRDGQSTYFLNNVRCRRRDIMDLFLGTGLGPRSYAIIEQGMISRFVEAKPEDLRVFIEEAAGISKYKERRRETENRIRHTRENLERLNDLREEVGKQLEKLKRQARTAERYQELKTEERQYKGQHLALQWQALDEQSRQRSLGMQQQEAEVEGAMAEIRSIEKRIELSRQKQSEAAEAFSKIQGEYYGLGAEIGRIEQDINHNRDRRRQQQTDLDAVQRQLEDTLSHQGADQERLAELDERLAELEPMLEAFKEEELMAGEALSEAELALDSWREEWDHTNRQAAAPTEQAQLHRARINQLEQQQTQIRSRTARLEEERRRLSDAGLAEEIAELEMQFEAQEEQSLMLQDSLQQAHDGIERERNELNRLNDELNRRRAAQQRLQGRIASLEALQEQALGSSDRALNSWLQAQGLADGRRLAEALIVSSGWEAAVEHVLSGFLDAVCDVEQLSIEAFAELKQGNLTLVDGALQDSIADGGSLLAKVGMAGPLAPLLAKVRAAESLNAAWAMRDQLAADESVISPEGIWIAPGWVRLMRGDGEEGGVLAREQALRDLQEEQALEQAAVEDLEASMQSARERLADAERRREEHQRELNQLTRERGELQSRISARRARQEEFQGRRIQLEEELAELGSQLELEAEELLVMRERLHEALEEAERFSQEREKLSARRDSLQQRVEDSRRQTRSLQDRIHHSALELERMRAEQTSTRGALQRVLQSLQQLEQRREDLQMQLLAADEPLEGLNEALEEKLAERLSVEQDLAAARNHNEALEKALREDEQTRHSTDMKVQGMREALENARLDHRETLIRRQTVQDQLAASEYKLQEVLAEMPEEAEEAAWQRRLKELDDAIRRLGAINLAAIDEYAAQSERMNYLNAQYDDVSESLETLEQAIAKIDRETRTRFKETFDKVNSGFQRMFPRLFGGGHASLELTGTDLLETGISIMARPPGKKNSTIHLLSGGEKALTAVSLVFAIFELNPAPFCMLDEVDAPLDDANVGRFCELVRAMSEQVQFIFITHNKVTMELSDHLSGVTMQEPGVSRLVSVDLEEAAQMAGL